MIAENATQENVVLVEHDGEMAAGRDLPSLCCMIELKNKFYCYSEIWNKLCKSTIGEEGKKGEKFPVFGFSDFLSKGGLVWRKERETVKDHTKNQRRCSLTG